MKENQTGEAISRTEKIREMYTKCWQESLKESDQYRRRFNDNTKKDLDVYIMCVELFWLRVRTSERPLWARQ
jgi:hypothetical protein